MDVANSPIQRKLMKIILLTSGAVLILTCAILFAYEFITFRQADKSHLSTLGEIIASNSTAALAFHDPDNAAEILEALKAEKHIDAACLYDTLGRLFALYPLYLKRSDFPAHPEGGGYRYEGSFLLGFQPVILKKRVIGMLYIKANTNAMYGRFQLYGLILLLVVSVAALLAFFLSIRLQKTISGPILSLADTASIISNKGDYTVRANKIANDELGLLTDAFNLMLGRIEMQNEEILAFNQALEKKVSERTAELADSNHELNVQNRFVQAILDASLHHIAVVDRDMKFTTINRMVESLYGVKKVDVVGKGYTEVFPKAKNSRAHMDITSALNGQYVHNNLVKSSLVDGYFETHFIPLRGDDEVYGALILSHDISKMVQVNEQLMKVNAQLEKSNNDLEQFAYIASHDLQEPLRKIRIFSEYAQQNLDDKDESRKYLSKITYSAERMSDLINAVLNYSRLSKAEEHFDPVDLNEIIDSIQLDFELVIKEKGAVILYKDLPVVQGSKLQLNQLFSNLISNSLKFSNKDPVISITAIAVSGSEIEGREAPRDDRYCKITLQDNGIGFEQQYAAKIFQVFQRLHHKNNFPGTGIGLALCKKIVDNHHGFITADGNIGEGAAFKIYLPLNL